MIVGTSKNKDLEQGWIGVRNCHLCGKEFIVGMYDTDTICPKCKELWQIIIKERGKVKE